MKLVSMTSIILLAFTAAANAQSDQHDATPAAPSDGATATAAPSEPQQGSAPNTADQAASTPDGAQPTAEGIPVPAVDAPAKEAKAPAATGPQRLDDVMVTATKTEKSSRDIPVSVQAMKGDDLVQQGATTLEDMLKNSPAVNITEEEVSIRGVGLTALQTNSQGHETGFFLGESPMAPPSTGGANIDFDPYDLSTVEILEGPQSTLFGGTALGGAIRYIPNKPEMGAFHGGLRMGYGQLYDAADPLKDISAMLNVPVGDHFSLRAAGTFREKPDVGKNIGGTTALNASEVKQIRGMARWEITDRLIADVLYSHMGKEGNLSLLNDPHSYDTTFNRVAEPDTGQVDVGTASLTYNFDAFSVVGVANSLKNNRSSTLDASPILGIPPSLITLPSTTLADAKVPSYELRLVSSHPSESSWWLFDNWDYIAGLYYMKADQHTEAILTANPEEISAVLGGLLPGGADVPVTTSDAFVNISEKALYFNLNKYVFDRKLEVNLGARFAETTLSATMNQATAGVQYGSETHDDNGHRINPKYALTWHFTDDLNIRASMSEGFRFGGANATTTGKAEGIPDTFHSDSLRNYELGLRSDWFGHTLRFDLTGYRIDWSDLQVTQLSPLASGYTDNIGAAVINGLEGQFSWRLPYDWPLVPAGLTLTSGFSYLDSRTSEDFDSANGKVPSGTRLPLSPHTSATLGLSWTGFWREWVMNSNAQASYAGNRTNQLLETYKLDPYTVVDASFRIANPTWPGAPAITLSGINLTNEMILNFANASTIDPKQFSFTAQGPRSVKLSLELSF